MTAMALVPKLHEVVLADVLAAVIRNDYEEGERLPKETALAESFSVSRYVARQAVQALRDRGVVAVTHGVGAVVTPRHRWNLFDPVLLEAMLAGPDADAAAAEARETAATVWPHVAALAAKRRTNADLDRLAAAEDGQEVRNALVQAARNRFLGQAVIALDELAGARQDAVDYAVVVEEVRARDADAAAAAMSAVLRRSRRKG